MKRAVLLTLIGIASLLSVIPSNAQQLSYSDAAQAYNRLLIERGNGTFQRISTYKVQGTQFLFGEKHQGNMFAAGETAYNIRLSYNTYNQELEFNSSANPTQPLVKSAKEVDSFVIKPNADLGIAENLKFVNGRHLKASDNSFYQVVYAGSKFSLYKKYKSTLGIVTTNYIDADLRQFNLEYEYFYFDEATKELKKLKLNNSFVKKEFKQVSDIETILERDPLGGNPEVALKEIFIFLNQ
ncbi:MAG: hypothetical protein EOO52_20110 [Gammaproteobacteria bacterium]|nr:MAG: hypothetical protein EOO52_20110 [Gammaproteobacteria bacterium]